MKGTVESWLGRNLVAVIAAVLVFVGLVLLAATLAPELTDEAKAAFMFALSGALAAGGFFAARRHKNGFTVALLGCGASSLFISVMVCHLVFGLIGILPAYALLLAWMAGCLAMSSAVRSVLLGVVVQLGLAASLVLGYGGGADGARLALLVGYQLAATVVLVGGNMRSARGAYCETLVSALALSVIGGGFICSAVEHAGESGLDAGWAAAALLVQFVQSTALAMLVAAAAVRGGSGKLAVESSERPLSDTARTWLMVAAAGLWFCAVRIDAVHAVQALFADGGFATGNVAAIDASMGVAAILIAVAAIGVACIARARLACLEGSPLRAMLLVLVFGGAITCADRFAAVLFAQTLEAHVVVGWLVVWAVLPLVLARLTGDALHNRVSFSFALIATYSLCCATMPGCNIVLGGMYGILACAGCTLAVCALCTAIIAALWRERAGAADTGSRRVLIVLLLLCSEASVLAIAAQPGFPYAGAIACPLAACALAVLHFAAPRVLGASFGNVLFANELVVMLFCLPFVLAAPDGIAASALFGIFAAGCIALLVLRFAEELVRPAGTMQHAAQGQPARLVLGAAMLIALVLAYATSCTPFAEEGFQVSVICMGCGLLCVFAGFLKNVRALHLFGLVVALASVAKLVLVDVASASSLAHVGAYIGGGLVCFAISAVYNRALHRKASRLGE